VRRIFTERARLVVYIELEDLNRLTAVARGDGKTLVEWAREVLLEAGQETTTVEVEVTRPMVVEKPLAHCKIEGLSVPDADNTDVRRSAEVRVAERGAGVAERVEAPVLAAGERAKKTCRHGVEKGYHCWQCRGIAE
jgi:hypothetical protein